MSAATSPGTGLAYGLRRVCAAWGMARSSFYTMTSGQHAEQPPAKRRGPKPAISDQALLVAIEADLEASPGGKVWARLRVCRDIRVARKRGPPDAREQSALASAAIPMTVRSSLMPRTSCGAPMDVRVFTVDDGSIFTAVEHWASVSAGASPPCSRSPWGLPGCMARPRPARLGGWPCGSAPSICLHQPDQVLGHPAVFVAEPQTNGVAERSIAR